MPRPKRTKVASTALRARPPPAPAVQADPIEDDIYGISDSPERIIVNSKRVKRTNPASQDISTTAAGSGQRVGALKSGRKQDLDQQKLRRDEAIGRLEAENDSSSASIDLPIQSTEIVSSSPPGEVGRKERGRQDTSGVVNIFRRSRQPSILGRGRRGRSSSVDSELAESTGLINKPRGNISMQISGIRRRTRQPSILGRRARSSSIGLEMTPANPGSVLNGRRRTRQPSILGTTRKAMPAEEDYDDLDSLEDGEDFAPEDESTPLNVAKSRDVVEASSQPVISATRGRKRKSSPLDEPESSSSAPPAEVDSEPELEQESQSMPEDLPRVEDLRPVTPEPFSETMAPPQSSSPPEEILRPSRRANIQRAAAPSTRRQQPSRRKAVTPPLYDDDSLPSSPPSLTHSPNQPVRSHAAPKRAPRAAPDPATFSTIQLTSLLPRRRHRNRDQFAIDSDDDVAIDATGLGSDDDELSHLNIRARNNRRTPAPTRRVTKLKTKAKGTASVTSKRTYGARRESNEENQAEEEVDPDDSLAPIPDDGDGDSPENSQILEERVGKELKKAKRKFEVVDKWELEFEENTASSSSPWDGR